MTVFALSRRLAPCLLAVGLAACSSQPHQAGAGQDPRYQPAAASDFLAQTGWDLARWTKPGGALRPVPHPSTGSRPLTVSFIHERGAPRIAGYSGCNQYTASYTVANGLLIVRDRPVSTMMACAPGNMGLERDFLASMARITASSVDNANNPQRMTWVLDTGDRLDFGRRTDPIAGGQQGPTKLVYVNAEKVPCSTSAGRAMCYQVRDSAAQPWQPWQGEITGFQFQPGIRYRLRVVELPDPDPGADPPSVRWVLDAVVEQEIVSR